MAKLSGALPKGERNGIAALEAQFVDDPTRTHVFIVVADTAKVTQNIDTGDVEPTLRILRIESILPKDARTAETLVRRALEGRTGVKTLDIDLADEISKIFSDASIDVRTGEQHLTFIPRKRDKKGGDDE
jgi:hypothetical protein